MATMERPAPLTGRAAAIRDAARKLLEEDGPDGLAMRALAHEVGAHPPAVYRHFADKSAVEAAVVSEGLYELGDAMLEALEGTDDQLTAIAMAYRGWAHQHPHLYRLVMGRPLDPANADAQFYAGAPVRRVTHDDVTAARSVWACVHGLTILELDGRLPEDSDVEGIWAFGLAALRGKLPG